MMRARVRRAIKETKKKAGEMCVTWFHIAKDTHLIEGNV